MFFDLLIEAQQLAALLKPKFEPQPDEAVREGKLKIVSVCPQHIFQQVAIPGAINIPIQLLLNLSGAQGLMPNKQSIEQLLKILELTPETQIVVYDTEGGGWATRLIWILTYLGHKNVRYLNGGLQSWLAWNKQNHKQWLENHLTHNASQKQSDKGILNKRTYPDSKEFTYYIKQLTKTNAEHAKYAVEISEIIDKNTKSDKNHLRKVSNNNSNLQLWDVRTIAEYQAGHLPGAILLEYEKLLDAELKLKEPAILKQMLLDAGFDLTKEIITYCQIHHRASLANFVLKLLDCKTRAYLGSYTEWSKHGPQLNL